MKKILIVIGWCLFTLTSCQFIEGMANGMYGYGSTGSIYNSGATYSGGTYSQSNGSSSSGTEWRNCSVCGGTGRCKSCGGSGNDSYTKNGKCGVCRGNGKCAGCNGKGGYTI